MPPDLGAAAIVCGEPDTYAATEEDFTALQGCDRFLGNVALGFADSGLSKLSSLRVIDGLLSNTGNEEIQTLAGLDSLEWTGSLSLNRGGFTTLAALGRLEGIADVLRIWAETELVDLRGLDAVATVGGNAFVASNDELTSLDGVGRLEWIGGDLVVQNNPKLVSLAGLSSLRQVDGDVTIIVNDQLPTSEIDALLARIQVGGQVTLDP